MCSQRKRGASLNEVITYTLPKLHSGKSWYVDFKCFDPVDREMKRKKYMLNGIDKVSERKKRATEIITNLTNRLRSGWNPWADTSNSRHYSKFNDVQELYSKYLSKLSSSKVIKDSTYTDYKKRIRMLIEYNDNLAYPIVYMYQFDQTYVSDFLDYILLDRDSSARTRNNYRIWLSSFSNWLIEKEYMEKNPIEKIKSLVEDEKKRSPLSSLELKQLNVYLRKTNKYFLLACQMEYYTFIRPEELSNIKLNDISIKEQKVFVSSIISKNRKDGMVGLNDEIIKLMIDLHIFDYSSNCYLFGGNDFKPSMKKVDSRVFRNYFNKVREALRFPDTLKFYSLKDSGIRDLANAAGIVIARDQARHSDISTTNKYLKGNGLSVHEETKHFEGDL